MTETAPDELLELRSEDDVVRARQTVRRWARELGFSLVDETKTVTAASEIARNTVVHAGGGTLTIRVLRDGRRSGLALHFEDSGPGIPDLALASSSSVKSPSTVPSVSDRVARLMFVSGARANST